MKRFYLLSAIVALLFISCNHTTDEPAQAQQVVFRVQGLTAETEPMQMPAASGLTDDDGNQLTDLYLFDGTELLAHQVSTDDGFGTITVQLMAGIHNLHFVATRSKGLSYADGLLSMSSVRPTFGGHLLLNVTGSSEQNVSLERITGQIVLTIEDEIPSEAKTLTIKIGDYCKALQVESFNGANNNPFEQDVDISSKVGTTGYTVRLNHLVPTYATQIETTYDISIKDASNAVIAQATGTMPINSNTKTLLHGDLFTGTKSFVILSTAWNADIDVDM